MLIVPLSLLYDLGQVTEQSSSEQEGHWTR